MRYFSVPADFKEETLNELAKLNKKYCDSKVIEVYGQMTNARIKNSGRVTDMLPPIDNNTFLSYVNKAKSLNIDFHYTLNPACMGNLEFSENGIHEIQGLIQELADMGINSFTMASPAIMELCKKLNPDLKIKCSAICEVNSPYKSLFYKRMGVERVVIDPDITRDFKKLRTICDVYGPGVEIIINNVCMRNCPYKMFHYNHEAHCTLDSKQEIRDYYTNRCAMQKARCIENPIKLNWIRPEDLKYYEMCGIHYFKIQGRQNVVKGNIIKTIEAYFEESYDGNLFDLITLFAPYNSFQCYIDNKKLNGFIENFYNDGAFCTENCSKCNYCQNFAAKSIDVKLEQQLNDKAQQFYKDYDIYSKAIEVKKISEMESFRNDTFEF